MVVKWSFKTNKKKRKETFQSEVDDIMLMSCGTQSKEIKAQHKRGVASGWSPITGCALVCML